MPYAIMALRKGERNGLYLRVERGSGDYTTIEEEGPLWTCDSSYTASSTCEQLNSHAQSFCWTYRGVAELHQFVKWQLRQITDDDRHAQWVKEREEEMKKPGVIMPPWQNEPWYKPLKGLYATLQNDTTYGPSVCFWPDKGLRGCLRLSINKFLSYCAGLYPEGAEWAKLALDTKIVRMWAGKAYALIGADTLHFARTRQEIKAIYSERGGPSSCMSHGVDSYASAPIHPTEVYAAGDLAIVYTTVDNTPEGRVSARALCFPERKVYGRVFSGNADRFTSVLEYNGFRHINTAEGAEDKDNFNGARLLALSNVPADQRRIVMPYLDLNQAAIERDGHLILQTLSPTRAYVRATTGATNGTVDWNTSQLKDLKVEQLSDTNATRCASCGNVLRGGNVHRVHSTSRVWQPFCEECANDEADYCSYSDKLWRAELLVRLSGTAVGQRWAQYYTTTHAFTCRNGGVYPRTDILEIFNEDGDDKIEVSVEYYMARDAVGMAPTLTARGKNLFNRFIQRYEFWYEDELRAHARGYSVVEWFSSIPFFNVEVDEAIDDDLEP